MDEVSRTFIDSGGFGGLGTGGTLGVGALGGLILGSMWNGNGFFGWGNNGRNGAVGYDTGVLNGLQDSVNNISNQINAADRDFLMQTSNQNQFVGNLVNQTGDAIVGAVNSGVQTLGAAVNSSTQNLANAVNSGNRDIQNSVAGLSQNVQNGIFQNTLSQVQGQAATNLGMCQGFNGVNAGIAGSTAVLSSALAGVNNNITEQNFENRLQAQQLASQQQSCCCQVLQAIEREGCANRELQREIQTQAIRDVLANTQAENQALKSQLFTTNAMAAQTATIINALKPAATTGA